jgi:transposase
MMHISGTNREQLSLFDETLDDIISEDNPVRFIDAYIDSLNLRKMGFFINSAGRKKGRPSYHPGMMLKLYIYGYMNRIRSSRKLETECGRNTELIWLTCNLSPDFKTIADFRKDNTSSLKKIFSEFLKLCQKLELLSFQCVAVDGTKKRAQNHLGNVYHKETIDQVSTQIREKIEKYIKELDENDKTEENEYSFLTQDIPRKLAKLQKKEQKIALIKQIFEENPDLEHYFAEDSDSRYMKDNNRTNAGYNCQSVVDEKHKLIVAENVTNENNDMHQLGSMMSVIKAVKEELDIENKTTIVADAGYFDEQEIVQAVTDEAFDVYVSHPRDAQAHNNKEHKEKIPSKGFQKDDFCYDKEKDVFICPAGKTLNKAGNGYIDKRTGKRQYKYQCRECNCCKDKDSCTKNKNGRSINATEFFSQIAEFREKCNSHLGKKLLSKRKEIVEHPFGTIKHNWNYRQFMQKGIEKVSAEFSFTAFIYNLKRVMNIMELDQLMAAI